MKDKILTFLTDARDLVTAMVPGGPVVEWLSRHHHRRLQRVMEALLSVVDKNLTENQKAHLRIMLREDPTFEEELALVVERALHDAHWEVKGLLLGRLIRERIRGSIDADLFRLSADLVLRATAAAIEALGRTVLVEDQSREDCGFWERTSDDDWVLLQQSGFGTTFRIGGIKATRIGELIRNLLLEPKA